MKERDTAKDWAKAIVIWAFLGIWIFAFTTSFYAGGCYKAKNTPEERLRICTNAKRLNGFLYTKHQEAGHSFAVGMALADLDRMEEATESFKFSLSHTNAAYRIQGQASLLRYLKDNARGINVTDNTRTAFFAAFVSLRGQTALDAVLSKP